MSNKVSGQDGMGMRKHGRSGRVGHNKSNAIRRSRETNQEIAQKQRILELRKPEMKGSIKELIP